MAKSAAASAGKWKDGGVTGIASPAFSTARNSNLLLQIASAACSLCQTAPKYDVL
jgi:hypothetical protein